MGATVFEFPNKEPTTKLEHACAHCAAGRLVFPTHWTDEAGKCSCGSPECDSPGKHPLGALVPRGHRDATDALFLVEDWWGKTPEANIALVPGPSGLIVLDADCKKGKVGLETLAQLEREYPILKGAPRVRTPSGGVHGYLRLPEGIAPIGNTSPFKDVDVRAHSGYVMAIGSVIGGKPYALISGSFDAIPDAPAGLLTQLGAVQSLQKRAHGRTIRSDGETELRREASDQDLMRAAETIPNDNLDWDEWNKFGMAFFAASGGEGGGLAAFLAWSAKSGKFNESPTQDRWAHYFSSPPNAIGWGFLQVQLVHAEMLAGRPQVIEQLREAANRGKEQEVELPPLNLLGDPELTGWPELTPDCLPAPLYRIVMSEAIRLNVDPCALAAHVLAACAASISDEWRYQPKLKDPYTQQARIWAAVIKDVSARGTATITSAFAPVEARERELGAKWKVQHAAWEIRARARKKNDPTEGGLDPEPKRPRRVTHDTTVEQAAALLAEAGEDAKLTVLTDELMTFLGSFGRYSKSDAASRAQWLMAYDGGRHDIDRVKTGNRHVANWSVNVAGNIQPRRLAEVADDLTSDGMFQRFLVVHMRPAEIGQPYDPEFDASAAEAYAGLHAVLDKLRPVQSLPVLPDDLAFVEGAAFSSLIERLTADPTLPYLIREMAGKWSGLLARISLIFHLVEKAEQMRLGQTVELPELHRMPGSCVAMASAFLRQIALPNLYRLAFDTMPEGGSLAAHARWVAGFILAHRATSITSSAIGRVYRPLRGQLALTRAVMGFLSDAQWVTEAEHRSDGSKWVINPRVHEFADAAAAEKRRRAKVQQLIRKKVTDFCKPRALEI